MRLISLLLLLRLSKFQSTHPHRMRPTASLIGVAFACFNPRTHIGCDVEGVLITSPKTSFNPRTHIGCDSDLESKSKHLSCFNPRTHIGCDSLFASFWAMPKGFHPRTHIGCDSRHSSRLKNCISFNPRTHIGCDKILDCFVNSAFVSIHAPT